MDATAPRNPFPVYKFPLDSVRDNPIIGWRWFAEDGREHDKLYASQTAALKDLVAYMHWLDHGPTLWERVWWPVRYTLWRKIKEFLRS